MELDPPPARGLLVRCWNAWAEALAALGPGDLATPTRCAGWDVHALAAHVAPDARALAGLADEVLQVEASVDDAAVLLRHFNDPAGGVAHELAGAVASAAVAAASSPTVDDLVARFRAGARIVGELALEPAAVLPHPIVGSVTAAVLTDVSILEATVHHLDLAAAVGGTGPDEAAVRYVRDLLVRVGDPVAFVEAATGRTCADGVLPLIR